ncbi:MAG: rhodanese-like domain-containing protein, partial [Peptostreptococcaceae bacterium]|nr:rhodanese-like domain-containing protein [Peptostreptococcaceae bacterium]
MSNLVNVKWLIDNLNNEKLVIVDCRFNLMDKEYGKRSYEEGHIKGAKRVDIERELSSVVKVHGGRHPIPSTNELKNTFENIGISDDSIVISYDEGDLAGASRLWWILKYLGHDKVYVLDGGLEAYKEAGGEIST